MMPRAGRPHKGVGPFFAVAGSAFGIAVLLSACASVPGETLASAGQRRDISRQVLAQARTATPACREPRVGDTEVVEVYPDGRVATERWAVEACGTRTYYRILFPAAGKATPVQVRHE